MKHHRLEAVCKEEIPVQVPNSASRCHGPVACGLLLTSCTPVFSLHFAQLLVDSDRSVSSSLSALCSVGGAAQFSNPAVVIG